LQLHLRWPSKKDLIIELLLKRKLFLIAILSFMKSVYIFRGAPASGKGTVIPEFAKLLQKPIALIEQDIFRWRFHLIGRGISDVKSDEHLFAYKNMVLIYEEYLKNGNYAIILEGLFTWDDETSSQGCAKNLLELANKYGYDTKSIVFAADKSVLIKRNSEREYSVPSEEFNELYNNIYKSIGPDEIVIDSTNQTVDETLQALKILV
jgi:predicted kinase